MSDKQKFPWLLTTLGIFFAVLVANIIVEFLRSTFGLLAIIAVAVLIGWLGFRLQKKNNRG